MENNTDDKKDPFKEALESLDGADEKLNELKKLILKRESLKERVLNFISSGISAIVVVGIVALVMGYPLKLLWNWIMPDLCGFGKLTFWKALGMIIIFYLVIPTSSAKNK